MPAGCREQRAGTGQAAGRPSQRSGWAQPAAPLPARAGSDPRLCARIIPARQLPARTTRPSLQVTETGNTSLLHSYLCPHLLTAREPMEMHQKLLSNELILVQSCHQSFCCSACHNLLCLVQPVSLPGLPHEPAVMPLPSIPTANPGPLWAAQPQVRSLRTLQLAVGEALKASSVQSYRYRSWRWLDFLHVLALWGSGGSPVLCPVPPCARAMWLLTQRVGTRGGDHSQMRSSPRRWCR